MSEIAILAGGSGTRLWPASHPRRPKQFMKIPGEVTLLEQAVARAESIVGLEHVWIVTLEEQLDLTRETVPHLPDDQILAEPMGRNSGPAAALATFAVEAARGRPVPVMILTADHYISNTKKFGEAARLLLTRALEGESLLTFGLRIRSARTDFGYIEGEKPKRRQVFRRVKRFIEKPPLAKARAFSRSKLFFWNSGMFAWRSDRFKAELARHAPDIAEPLRLHFENPGAKGNLADTYERLPNISIDYALMEKSGIIDVLPADFPWSDVGSWKAVHEATAKSERANSIMGLGAAIEGKGNLVYSTGKNIVLYGVDDLVVVEGDSAILVTTARHSEELKRLHKLLTSRSSRMK